MTTRLTGGVYWILTDSNMSVHRGAHGTQFRFTDMRAPATQVRQGALLKPDFDYTNLGLLFPQNDATEIAYIIMQAPHELQNDTIYPHIHFIQSVAQQPTFQMDYRIVENGDNNAYKAFTTITAATFAFTWVSGDLLQVASFPSIDISGLTSVSWIIDVKLYRNDNVVAGDVLVKEFDIHYTQDDWGSRQEFIK